MTEKKHWINSQEEDLCPILICGGVLHRKSSEDPAAKRYVRIILGAIIQPGGISLEIENVGVIVEKSYGPTQEGEIELSCDHFFHTFRESCERLRKQARELGISDMNIESEDTP